jgi:CubicO group peptidase (beta-lactamase class C family)
MVLRAGFAFVCFACFLAGASGYPSFARLVFDEMKQQQIPGVAVAIVKRDAIVYSRGFGVASVETREPLSAEHLIRFASTTKMLVAATALEVARQGKLDLHVPIGRYVSGLDAAIARLSVHQLLSHTGGLRDGGPGDGSKVDFSTLDRAARTLTASDLFAAPGTVCSYSNLGYVLAGNVIQEVGSKPFDQVVGDYVLAPLGMRRSTFRMNIAITYPVSQPHLVNTAKKRLYSVRLPTTRVSGQPVRCSQMSMNLHASQLPP